MSTQILILSTLVSQVFINILLFSGVIYFVIAVWTLQHLHVKAARTFILLMICSGLYSLGYFAQLGSNDIQEFSLWLRIESLGFPFIPFLWLMFIMQYTDWDQKIKPYMWALFFLIPTVTFITLIADPVSSLFYKDLVIEQQNGLLVFLYTPGAMHNIHYLSANLSILCGIIVLITAFRKSGTHLRVRYLWLLAGATIPWVAFILFLTGNTPNNLDLTPFGLIFTAVFVIIELSRNKIFNILPLARSQIFEVIDKGIIIVDQKNNVADINPSAKSLLGLNNNDNTGINIFSIFPEKESFLNDLFSSEVASKEILCEQDSCKSKWLEVSCRSLTNKKGYLLGRLITLNDITIRKENEDALSNERILLRTLVDNIPMSVYVKDTQGRKILANKADMIYMGVENESEALGKTDFDIYPHEIATEFRANDLQVLNSDEATIDKEEILFRENGEERWLLTSKVPFKDTNGKMLGLMGIGRDISDWKKMQQDLSDSEERFRTLSETTSAAVFIFQGSEYIYLNPASERLTGYSNKEMEQMKFLDIVHPDFKEIVESKGINNNNGKQNPCRFEFKIITKTGEEKWIDFSSGVTLYKGKLASIGTSFDITERKIAEEALSLSEQRYRKIFENSNTGIIQVYPNRKILNANNAFAQLMGYANDEQLFNDENDIFEKLFADKTAQKHFFSEINEKHIIKNFEFEAMPLNGNKIWMVVNAWKDKGSVGSGYIIEGFFQDITDRKLSHEYQNEIEIARKSSETKNQFLANMSHEIRTPVTGIMGMTDVLSTTTLSQQQQEYLATIEESSQKLLQIINEILDISKIEAGKLEICYQPFNLTEMLGSLKNMFEPEARKRNLNLEFNIHTDVPLWLNGDKKRIGQILMNLVSNALKFTDSGNVSVNIGSQKISKNKYTVEFGVTDTGVGINLNDQALLFRKFAQLDNSLTRASDGTGLGLFICRELVKLMGGAINVHSTPGKGSKFCFHIIMESVSEPESQDKSLHNFKPFVAHGVNILIVDDKLVNQKVLALMLQGEKCNVDVASNGQQAIDMFDPGKHQLIFMDIMMPVMDGITAMKLLHKKYPEMPPIIALTANAMEGDAQNYLESGFNDYLSKPVSRKELQHMIMKWTFVRS